LRILPPLQDELYSVLDEITRSYPDELVFDWNGFELELIPAERLSLAFPQLSDQDSSLFPEQAVVFLPEEKSPEEFSVSPKQSLAVVAPTQVYISNQQTWSTVP